MHFGASLRLLRTSAGLSLRDLAGSIGVSPAYLSRVEHGHDAPPTPDRLQAIARTLGVPTALLLDLTGRGAETEASFAARALHHEVVRRGLGPAQVGRILDFIHRTWPEEAPVSGGVAERLGGRVVRGVRVPGAADAAELVAARLTASPAPLADALRRSATDGTVGGGLLLVHASSGPSAAMILVLSAPLAEGTPDGVPVRVVLGLTGVPAGAAGLGLLGRAARLADPALVTAITAAHTDEEVVQAVRLGERG